MKLIILISLLFLMACSNTKVQKAQSDVWKQLYNGKDLLGWDTYIGAPLDDSGKMLTNVPVGLNKDPDNFLRS